MPAGPFLDRRLVDAVSRLAGVLAVIVALSVPTAYLTVAFNTRVAELATSARVKARLVIPIINISPTLWTYQTARLDSLLGGLENISSPELTMILDLEENEVTRHGGTPAWPRISQSVPLSESGRQVGWLREISSVRGILFATGALLVLSILLGSMIFYFLRVIPLRLLNQTFDALIHEKERAEVTLQSIGDAVITTDSAGVIENMNPIAARLTGWSAESAVGQPLDMVMRLIDEDTGQEIENPLMRVLARKQAVPRQRAAVMVSRDGQRLAIEDSAAPIRLPDGDVIGGVMVLRDVSASRDLSRRLSWQASHDALTGLINRREFDRLLEDGLDRLHSTSQKHVLLYLDLDQFKVVNDTCGHSAGDDLLRQVTDMMQDRLRDADLLARLGGDEFAVLLTGCSVEQGQLVAESLLEVVNEFRFSWHEKVFRVSVSIGIVPLMPTFKDREEVLAAADAACYAAKEAGRGRAKTYHPNDIEIMRQREEMNWTSHILRAIEDDRFALYCQEYQSLSEHANGGRHLEILLRMIDDTGRIVNPGAFIPAAERYGLMPQIDRWVVARVFSRFADLQARFGEDFVCGINLSGMSLNGENMFEYVREQAKRNGVRPGSICFEITETAAINRLRNASQFVRDLKAEGFRFGLDDFGTGTSSFSYLRNLDVDYLKIDGTFVREIASDPTSKAVVRAFNDIGHALDLQTVAEFVDSPMVLRELADIGVDFAQGYTICRPTPIEDFDPAVEIADDHRIA